MEVEVVDIKKLKPHPQNPRVHPPSALDKLVKSIKEYGWTNPVLVSQDGYILAGHARVKAAEQAGIAEIPIIRLPLKGKKAAAYLIADNKLQDLTDWDYPKLKDLLEDLDTGDIDIEITGFDVKEIENLLTQFYVPEEGLTDDDEVPEKVETVCKLGDLWLLGGENGHRLLCGDATNEDDVERLMGGEKADLVFTDPPYGINIQRPDGTVGGGGKDKLIKKGKRSQHFPVFKGDDKPFDPATILNLGVSRMIIFGANHFADKLPASPGWIVWNKRDENWESNNFSDSELAWTNFDMPVRAYYHIWSGLVRQGNRKDELLSRAHPTQKPVGLCYSIIKDYLSDGNIVLDIYAGSGSTLIACEKLSYRCFAMEIMPEYCSVILKRWANFTGKDPVRDDGVKLSEL